MGTFAEIVRSRADDDVVGLRFEDRAWTWAEVVQESADRAALLAGMPTPESRQLHVGVLLENVPDFVFWIGAAALAGAAVVGINPTRRGAELAHDIRHTDCDLIVTENRLAELLVGIDHGVPADAVLDVDRPDYAQRLAPHRGAALPAELPDPDAIMLLLFSSGSTGAPKAVICSQGRFGYLAETLAGTQRADPRFGGLPVHAVVPRQLGDDEPCAVVLRRATPCAWPGSSPPPGSSATSTATGPPMPTTSAGRCPMCWRSRPIPGTPTSSLQLVVGTEASAADARRFAERFGCRVQEGYGLSEGVLRINRNADSPPDALGVPVGGIDARVMNDATGLECPPARLDEGGRLLNAEEAIGQIVALGKAHTLRGLLPQPGGDGRSHPR